MFSRHAMPRSNDAALQSENADSTVFVWDRSADLSTLLLGNMDYATPAMRSSSTSNRSNTRGAGAPSNFIRRPKEL